MVSPLAVFKHPRRKEGNETFPAWTCSNHVNLSCSRATLPMKCNLPRFHFLSFLFMDVYALLWFIQVCYELAVLSQARQRAQLHNLSS